MFCTCVDFEGVDWKPVQTQLLQLHGTNCTTCTKHQLHDTKHELHQVHGTKHQVHQTRRTKGGGNAPTYRCRSGAHRVHPRPWSISNARCRQNQSQKVRKNLGKKKSFTKGGFFSWFSEKVKFSLDLNAIHRSSILHNQMSFNLNLKYRALQLKKKKIFGVEQWNP